MSLAFFIAYHLNILPLQRFTIHRNTSRIIYVNCSLRFFYLTILHAIKSKTMKEKEEVTLSLLCTKYIPCDGMHLCKQNKIVVRIYWATTSSAGGVSSFSLTSSSSGWVDSSFCCFSISFLKFSISS